MNDQPLVSVLMTSYNREKYIGAAIESVLASSYQHFELIICDDVSKDRTVEIARAYEAKDKRIKVYVNGKNLGDYPNRNKAASHAKGKYLKYLDADDLLYYYGLEVMVNYMERFPSAGFGLASIVSNEAPFPICIDPKTIYLENFFAYNHFDRAPGSSIIKREAFESVGGFSGKRMIGDYELWLRLARAFSMVKFPFDLYWNRLHDEQESKSAYAKKYPELRATVLEEALAHPDCPLKGPELSRIRSLIRKRERKDKVIRTIAKTKKKLSLK